MDLSLFSVFFLFASAAYLITSRIAGPLLALLSTIVCLRCELIFWTKDYIKALLLLFFSDVLFKDKSLIEKLLFIGVTISFVSVLFETFVPYFLTDKLL